MGKHDTQLPRYKKPLAYSTLMQFRAYVIQEIAEKWYGLNTDSMMKIEIIDQILEQQLVEYGEPTS